MIYTVCGSMKFMYTMRDLIDQNINNKDMWLYPYELYRNNRSEVISGVLIEKLRQLHFAKIEMSDKIIIVDRSNLKHEEEKDYFDLFNYIGEDTKAEIEYARKLNKPIDYISIRKDK